MNIEDYLDDLDMLSNRACGTETDALDLASDSLAFCKSLFDTFQQNGMLPEDADFDLSYMENLIDALTGELSAAVLYLKGQPPGRRVVESLRTISDNLREHNRLAKEEDRVPHVVEQGYSRLADRIESTAVNPPGPIIS